MNQNLQIALVGPPDPTRRMAADHSETDQQRRAEAADQPKHVPVSFGSRFSGTITCAPPNASSFAESSRTCGGTTSTGAAVRANTFAVTLGRRSPSSKLRG